MKARVGREHQRYSTEGHRLVVGTVPYTSHNEDDSLVVQVVLINSRKYPTEWVLPKGGWETDETAEECATRETWEEAGCRGVIRSALVVEAELEGQKEPQSRTYFAMDVTELENEWPEKNERDRKLFSVSEAMDILTSQSRRKDTKVQMTAINNFLEWLREIQVRPIV